MQHDTSPLHRFALVFLITVSAFGCSSTGTGSSSFSNLGSALLNSAGVNVSSTDIDNYFAAGSKLARAARGFTDEQEYYLGRGVAAVVLHKYRPLNNPNLTRYANLVARSLAISSDRPETFGGYHVMILDTTEVNAVSAPGGFIFISKGMIARMPNEDALAAVLAHEIGHIVKGHGVSAISQSNVTSALTTIGKGVAESQGDVVVQQLTSTFGDSITEVTNTLLEKGYSRSQEYEADEYGAELLKSAGYDQGAMVAMLTSLKKQEGGSGGWSSTHPSPERRISNVEDEISDGGAGATNQAVRAARFSAATRGLL